MRKVGLDFSIDVTAPTPAKEAHSIVVPMPEPVGVPDAYTHLGEPPSMWIYRMADGTAYGAVARWETEPKKTIRPITWDGNTFVGLGFAQGCPLLNAHVVASLPVAPILVVEGEKTADAAAQYLPDGWVVVTWSGGSSAVAKSDWSILQGHDVVIWPDNDEPGLKAADQIRTILSRLGVPSSVVTMSAAFPDRWDLADPLPVGDAKTVQQVLRKNLKQVSLIEMAEVEEELQQIEQEDQDNEADDEDIHRHFRALGYSGQIYFVMPYAQKQVHPYKARDLMSQTGCMEIVNDVVFWDRNFGDEKGKIDWAKAGAYIMKLCTDAGVYDSNKIRERGVWSDQDRVVLHTGEMLIVDGKAVNPARMRSSFIYPLRPNLLEEWNGLDDPAPDGYGRLIRDACNKVRWEKPIYGDLLAGWIATAIVCGGLRWRTHCWITGNQGSGKTTVVDSIAGACLGSLALYPVGASTEAGIRSAVGNDAMPVVFDESEATDNKESRRAAVIQLMRQSSSETRGRIMKGSANHTSVTFSLRSAFLMSSIGVGLKEAADLSRTAVLTVRPLDAVTAGDRLVQEQQWKDFQAACARVPHDAPQRLLARQVNNLKALRENIEIFKEVIAVSLGNRRLGDQLGTLLAGLFSLFSKNNVSHKTCEKFLQDYDWNEFTIVKTQREDLALIFHIAASMVRVDTSYGVKERAIGELIEIALLNVQDTEISHNNADVTLKRYGIKIDKETGTIAIGISVPNLNRLMQTSDYFEGWARVLARHPYATPGHNPTKFAGVSSRTIILPQQEFLRIEG